MLRRLAHFTLLVGAAAWMAFGNDATGDYPFDAGPSVHALAHGHLGAYLSLHPAMGPFATLAQAPFAALAGGGELAEYQWGSLACLLVAGSIGLYLASLARKRGVPFLGQALIAGLFLVNPLSFEALQMGHPEEILTAALAVAAIATASQGHTRRTAILLGLALASKQWALIAVLPAVLALPAGRVKALLGAAALSLALYVPGIAAAPGDFLGMQGQLASTGHFAGQWSVWFPLTSLTAQHLSVGGQQMVVHIHTAPPLLEAITHPLILLLGAAVPLALWARRGFSRFDGGEALALFAMLALLRCLLDPVDNAYYHLPVLLALLGCDVFTAPRLPLLGMAAAAIALYLSRWSASVTDQQAFNLTYLAVAGGALAALIGMVLRAGSKTAPQSQVADFLLGKIRLMRI